MKILLNMIIGKSSKLYKELYDKEILFSAPSLDYEFSRGYAHVLITGQSKNPKEVFESFKKEVEKMKQNNIDTKEFNRIRKRIYGEYIKEYNDVSDIARMFLSDFFKGINSFEYLEEVINISKEYVEKILKDVFVDDKMIISVIKR